MRVSLRSVEAHMQENPRVRSVLAALAKNDPDARVTRSAKACLAELSKLPPKK